jgi:hypothetical protein
MLWALASSAYVIFLYRKLRAKAEAPSEPAPGAAGTLDAALGTLEQRLSSLEGQAAGLPEKEAAR